MIKQVLFVFILLGIGLFGCGKGKISSPQDVPDGPALPEEMPDDFNFSYQYGIDAKNELNTFEGTYTKDLVMDGTTATDLVLNQDEMQKIYTKMKEIHILQAPDSVTNRNKDGSYCGSDPVSEQILEIQFNGEHHTLKWDTDNCITDELVDLMSFTEFLHKEIIFDKDEYKSLPEANGGYD